MAISVENVRRLAIRAHGKQKYGDLPSSYQLEVVVKVPYRYHLAAVVEVATRFGFAQKVILMACWLHDVLEDTRWTPEDLVAAGVPKSVIAIVVALTDGPGQSRHQQKAVVLRRLCLKKNRKARIVKLCDRIANVEFSIKHGPPEILDMYRAEHAEFEQLRDQHDTELEPMWQRLDELLVA